VLLQIGEKNSQIETDFFGGVQITAAEFSKINVALVVSFTTAQQ
jgi:hypothetical protein